MKVTVNFAAAAIGLSLALAIPQPAWSNIKNVVDLGAGNLSFDYGSSGFGNLTAWYVLQSGTVGSSGVAGATGLSFTAHTSPSLPLSASGTPQLLITYDLTNTTGSATQAIKFIAEVEPNGGSNRLDAAASSIAAGAGEPNAWAIQDLNSATFNLDQLIQQSGQLNNTNGCPALCDVDFALQWSIPALQPGQTSRLLVSLSDNGSHNSASFLSATHTDPSETLIFSGTAQVVPEPSTSLLLFAGLGIIAAGVFRGRWGSAATSCG